ncbi:hypothetical protein MHU86_19289 [Fragilaria crotonensis]|nr:hypothetical protein MHU86_19289 [Fragilaria crotonensis]
MGRLYKACERSKQAGKARLTKPQLDDLILWKAFLQKASRGISINRLVCRWPTRIVRVDACPQGIGGYCLKSGLAWRYQLPEHLLGRATLNTLEFLAAFVGMIVEFHEGAAWTDEDVLLSQGDSTSAAGWLAKSNFNDDCPLHLTIARAFADFCLTHEIDHYTQWFPGKENKVADMLSRDFALDDAALTDLITKTAHRLFHRTSGSSLCGQPLFRRLRLAAAAAQNAALADSTRAKRDSSWRCYERFLGRIDGVGGSLSPRTRTRSESRNVRLLRRRPSGRTASPRQPQEAGNGPLSGSIRATLDGVAQAFRLNKFESPIHDAAGRLDPFWLYN